MGRGAVGLGVVVVVVALGAGVAAGRPGSAVAALEAAGPRRVAAPQSYERWVRPPAPWPLERRVQRVVRAWAARHGLTLTADARLALAARGSLAEVPHSAGARIDAEILRARARRLGWTDGELAAVALRVPDGGDVGAALEVELGARLAGFEPNRVGVAARLEAGDRAVLVLFSRRLLQLWPTPAAVRRGSRFTVSGSLVPLVPSGGRSARLTLVVASPDGMIRRRDLPLANGGFDARVEAGDAAGVASVQLLVDRGRGPEIAAQLAVGVDRPIEPPSSAPVAFDDAAGEGPAGTDDSSGRLTALVLGTREAAGVALPAASAVLDEIATAHARDMHEGAFFAHVSPRFGDLTRRLAARGVRVSRALENLARADSLDGALRQWLESPAHRANLLDPDVDAFGVGVVPAANGDLLAVVVLARRADEGDERELAARALTRINAERLRRGVGALAWDDALAELAHAHARSAARGDAEPAELARRLATELDAAAADTEVLVANSIGGVVRSRRVGGAYARAGVGVARGLDGDGRLWITVLFAAD